MTSSRVCQPDHIKTSAFYHCDPTVPFWRANIHAGALFEAHAQRPERAQAWLRYREVSAGCFGFTRAVTMRGHFEGGILGGHTYSWTFTPGRKGDPAVVIPVFNEYRLVDFVAMSRHDHNVWGSCLGAGQYIGSLASPSLRVHRSLAGWLANDCDGILPLSKSFFPQLRNAPMLIAEDDEHADELMYRVFIDPAAKFGCDEEEAEQQAYNQIEVA